ncbi:MULTISPECIES: hypothetical protein [unclassified Moorena]|nr:MULTISPECIES: hypothetical protein [unclassified Moorena]
MFRTSLLPTPYSLLPTPYSLLPTPCSLLPIPFATNISIDYIDKLN